MNKEEKEEMNAFIIISMSANGHIGPKFSNVFQQEANQMIFILVTIRSFVHTDYRAQVLQKKIESLCFQSMG